MEFRALPTAIRLPIAFLCGASFLAIVFALLPLGAMRLNEAWDWPHWQGPIGHGLGALVMLGAFALFAYCSRLFARIGKGTPIPAEPPRHLVVEGLYRYSRNPIYVGQVGFLLGEFLYFGQPALLLYAALYAALIQVLIVSWEEPVLRERFGEAYARYTERVPRWISLRRP